MVLRIIKKYNIALYLSDCKTPNFGDRIGCEIGMDWGNILLGGCRLLKSEKSYIYMII